MRQAVGLQPLATAPVPRALPCAGISEAFGLGPRIWRYPRFHGFEREGGCILRKRLKTPGAETQLRNGIQYKRVIGKKGYCMAHPGAQTVQTRPGNLQFDIIPGSGLRKVS